jgi:hypothetical protein
MYHTHAQCSSFQPGCFGGEIGTYVDCSVYQKEGQMISVLPESFQPLVLTDDMDKAWLDLIKDFKLA